MTVNELIEKLQKLPKDLPVTYYTYDDYQDDPVAWYDIEVVEIAPDSNTVQLSY
jgi:hypothetical protein